MERWAIRGDVVLHSMLVGICELKTRDENLGKLIDDGVEGVNAGDMEVRNSGGAGHAGLHNFEVIEADEALVGHVNGKPVGGKEVGVENGFRDICLMKHLNECVRLAEQEGYIVFAPCFD